MLKFIVAYKLFLECSVPLSNMPVWRIETYGRPTLASRPHFGQFRGLAYSMLHCLGFWCEITNEIPSTKVYKACVQASQCRWMHSRSATISYWENGKFSSNLGELTLLKNPVGEVVITSLIGKSSSLSPHLTDPKCHTTLISGLPVD